MNDITKQIVIGWVVAGVVVVALAYGVYQSHQSMKEVRAELAKSLELGAFLRTSLVDQGGTGFGSTSANTVLVTGTSETGPFIASTTIMVNAIHATGTPTVNDGAATSTFSGGLQIFAGGSFQHTDLASCDTVDTDSNGFFRCGTDDGANIVLNDLTDVTLTSTSSGDLLFISGDRWINFAKGASSTILSSTGTGLLWNSHPSLVGLTVTGLTSLNGGFISRASSTVSSNLTIGGAFSASSTSAFNGLATFVYASTTAIDGFGGDLDLKRISGSTFSTVQELQDIFHSAGWTSGGNIADIGGGAISVAAGTGLVRTSNSATAVLPFFDWVASTTITITTDSIRYIGVEYNAGSPRVAIRTTYDWDLKTDFPLGNVVNEGDELHIENAPQAVGDHAATMIERTFESLGKQRDNIAGGLIIGETGSRNVTVSAGTLWERLTQFPISAIDTSGADTFDTYCGTTKNETATSTWDNLNYCNSGSLTALANNRWAVLWFYLELDGGLMMQYGTAQYTSEGAAEEEGTPSTVTNRIVAQGKLIGRFIFQESASTVESIETVFATVFAGSIVTDHGNLAGLGDDDHTQYLLVSGSRNSTGGQTFDGLLTISGSGTSTAVNGFEAAQLVANDYFETLTFRATSTSASSTIAFGLIVNALDVQSTSATSTFANGIRIEAGTIILEAIGANKPVYVTSNGTLKVWDTGFSFAVSSSTMSTTTQVFSFQLPNNVTLTEISCITTLQGTSTFQLGEGTRLVPNTLDKVMGASADVAMPCGPGFVNATTSFQNAGITAGAPLWFIIEDAEPTGEIPVTLNVSGTFTLDG